MTSEITKGFRLSPQQRHVWQMQQGSRAFCAQCALLIEGDLDRETLKAALRSVTDGSEILRTTFTQPAGLAVPVQVIHESGSLALVDARLEEEAAVEKLLQQAACMPFDFEHGPLLRVSMLQLQADRNFLIVTMPALCADTWSLGNLVCKISRAYEARANGERPADEAVQYADFAEWQNELLKAEEGEAGRQFWRTQNASAATAIRLPFETKPSALEFVPDVLALNLDSTLAAKINRTAAAEGATAAELLSACWQTLLWRLTKQTDIVVGNLVDGRRLDLLRDAFGLYEKYLPVVSCFQEDFTFDEALRVVSRSMRSGYAWQEYFDWSDAQVASGHSAETSFFPISFDYFQWPEPQTAVGLRFSLYMQNSCTSRFKLKLACSAKGDSLAAELHYDPAFYSAESIACTGEQFITLLASVLENPRERIDALEISGKAERRRLLVEWNQTWTDYPRTLCVHQLFEAEVERSAGRVAVVFEGEQLTYDELNARANQLAHHLTGLGVGPEVAVGICAERSLEMAIGLLGVLKAGGACVPLDPEYPKHRLASMIEQARPEVVLTHRGLRDLLPEGTAKVVYLDSDQDWINSPSKHNLNGKVTSDNTAFMIFTSGSTGSPKGVMLLHKGICNRLISGQQIYGLSQSDKVLQKASFSFDASIWEIFWPLTCGAQLILAQPGGQRDTGYLVGIIVERGITIVHFVPSMLDAFLQEEGVHKCRSLRRVFCGGEALSPELRERFFDSVSATLHNQYAPTETTVNVLYYTCTRESEPYEYQTRATPLGRPFANVQLYILDEQLNPAPVGVTGELYIGGDCLSRGYIDCPDQTAEKFVPSPFSTEIGARLYRSGDLARYLPDGNIEFIGRLDHQVKIRGYRVELSEVEAVLRQHPNVREAVAVAREDQSGQRALRAYVVPEPQRPIGIAVQGASSMSVGSGSLRPRQGDEQSVEPGTRIRRNSQAVSIEELREFLTERLPRYMVPSHIILLENLPLSRNGKTDRAALPEPVTEAKPDDDLVAPRTQIEELMTGVWRETLGVDRLGIHDTFFELGGHSLLATKLISRVRQLFKVEIGLRSLFEHPSVAGLAEEIEQKLRTGNGVETPAIKRVSRDGRIPLSFAQQRLWFLQQLEPESPFYNCHHAVRLEGALNISALERTFGEIVGRHEILRTRFIEVDGEPAQVIAEESEIRIEVTDLRDLDEREKRSRLEDLMKVEARRAFDLETGPLMRVGLVRVTESEQVLMVSMHHIVADGWSMEILVREVGELYGRYVRAEEAKLKELPVQYADYAVWQREWLKGETLEHQLSYWRSQLSSPLPVLQLPLDHPRRAVQTFNGDVRRSVFPVALSESLRSLSRGEGVTLFMTLLAGFQTLLGKYTGQEEIIVGTPIAGRTRPETEGLIGFFVNTLVLRADLSGNPSFRDLLRRVRELALEAHSNQELPFEKLVEELQPVRDPSRSPLFDVMFLLQDDPTPGFAMAGLEVTPLTAESGTSKFDLTLSIIDTGSELTSLVEYNPDLFEAATIERILAHYKTILDAIATSPDLKLSQIPLLTDTERNQMLVEWNRTATEFQQQGCVHQLFEAQVERTPENVAVLLDSERITYQKLNRRANQVAHYLLRRGIGPDVLVGICAERSLEMVVAILGVLKAGGAYLPLDPAYPRERLAFMLEDSRAPLLLTQRKLVDAMPKTSAQVVCLDEWETFAHETDENPGNSASDENLAYVIYTSGSTGEPKGTMITHRGIGNQLAWRQATYSLSDQDRVLQRVSFSFDASVWEFFGTLIAGARLVLMKQEDHQDPAYWIRLIAQHRITTLQIPPSMIQVLLEERDLERCSSLRQVITGGELLTVDLQERFFSRLSADLHNLYGPTEASIDVTFCDCRSKLHRGVSTIGKPIANVEVYLLDDWLQPVPVGVTGEIHIGGIGIARGYMYRPDLTAERFVPNPFSNAAGSRLYRTGDLARYLPDGSIEFVGRADQQVKLRGLRIELGDIEAAITRHPRVRKAAVLLREDVPGQKYLAAYIVPVEAESIDAAQLRGFLEERLPEYMLPPAFVFLESLPLTPNAKLDRKALPAPVLAGRESEKVYVPAGGATQEIVARIWSHLLGGKRVGLLDNFFELGGHSLLAAQAVSRIRDAFDIELPLRTLFEQPTVEGLSREIELASQTGCAWRDEPIRPAVREGKLPVSYSQQMLWTLDQMEAGNTAYNITTVVRLTGQLDITALKRALDEIVDRHEVLRTTFSEIDGEPVQVIRPAEPLPLRTVSVAELAAAEQEDRIRDLALEDAHQLFDLSRGPLFRIRLVRQSDESHVLLLTLHHIICDGWSLAVLTREVAALYSAFSEGKVSPLSDLPVQYADYSAWQRERLEGERLARQLDYWRQHLSGDLPALDLLTDRPRPVTLRYQGARLPLVLSPELTHELHALSNSESATLFMTLLAAFQTLLHRYSGQEDILVGAPFAGRNRVEIEGLIGFFVNTLVIRVNVGDNPTFRELVRRVREAVLGAQANQDVPFQKLVTELCPQRDPSRTPIFQALFTLQNGFAGDVTLPGLTLTQVDIDTGFAKFDLALSLTDNSDEITGSMQYNLDLFDEDTIQEMLYRYETLLREVTANPEYALLDIPLSNAEQSRLPGEGLSFKETATQSVDDAEAEFTF